MGAGKKFYVLLGQTLIRWLLHNHPIVSAATEYIRRVHLLRFGWRQSFGVRKPCLRLYGNKAEAWLSCQGHDKKSISVLECQIHVF